MFIMSKDNPRIALISANLGEYDYPPREHVPQSIPYDNHFFTDENFLPRTKAMTPRLQSKIPKCFGWQMVPGYDYYMWIDGNFVFTHKGSLKRFLDYCKDHDIVAFSHPKRKNIWEEWRYVRRGMHQSSFLLSRYENEFLEEQYQVINDDKEFEDKMLLNAGVFMYKNTPKVQGALKEWFYHMCRYDIMDQLAFSYVIQKAGLKINIFPDHYHDSEFVHGQNHKERRR